MFFCNIPNEKGKKHDLISQIKLGLICDITPENKMFARDNFMPFSPLPISFFLHPPSRGTEASVFQVEVN